MSLSGDRPKFAGMTTNERLFAAKLLDAFTAAIRARDRKEMIRLLEAVALEHDATPIADAVLADPARYGF